MALKKVARIIREYEPEITSGKQVGQEAISFSLSLFLIHSIFSISLGQVSQFRYLLTDE
tara:strand:- start:885 stop:1061 length:177 start_codon:yes stop_codon:yes gene_type:complete